MTQPLIDGDVLVYEIAAVGQYYDEDGELRLRPWDWVVETIDFRLNAICEAVEATQKPIIYLTGDTHLWKVKSRVRPSLPSYEPNFRIERAKLRKYKETRKVEKPYYYNSIRVHLIVEHGAWISRGCEADDEMAIEQTKRPEETIICTRDKDLRQVEGRHYGWESGKQAEFGPISYDSIGTLSLIKGTTSGGNPYTKLVGGGFKFFASQLLTGDPVDTVPGLPKHGPVAAFNLLGACDSKHGLLSVVRDRYEQCYPDDWKLQLREQCDLLWMIRHRNEDGSLRFFNPKEYL